MALLEINNNMVVTFVVVVVVVFKIHRKLSRIFVLLFCNAFTTNRAVVL